MAEEKKKPGAGFGVMLKKGNKVLLGRRNPDPDKADSAFRSAGEWTFPGGKLHWQETFEEGAAREVLEETGIKIKNPEVVAVHNNKNEHAHFVTVGLVAPEWEGEAQVMEPDEIVEWGWFDLDKLPEPLYFPTKEMIENHKAGKFYIKRP